MKGGFSGLWDYKYNNNYKIYFPPWGMSPYDSFFSGIPTLPHPFSHGNSTIQCLRAWALEWDTHVSSLKLCDLWASFSFPICKMGVRCNMKTKKDKQVPVKLLTLDSIKLLLLLLLLLWMFPLISGHVIQTEALGKQGLSLTPNSGPYHGHLW